MSLSNSQTYTDAQGKAPSLDRYAHEKALTKRILWKLDLHVLPILTLLWFANFIDRANAGNARIAGLEQDTSLVGNQFNVVLLVLFITYILVELPSNLVLKIVGAERWLPFLGVAWGLVTIFTSMCHNFAGLIVVRLLLGLCEGGLVSGVMIYLSNLYKPHELQQRVGIFFSAACMAGAFGGLLASAILKMDGLRGLAGWRWIFILEGVGTVFLSIVAAFILPADLASAKFLTAEERAFAVARFKTGESSRVDDHADPAEKGSLTDVDSEKGSPSSERMQVVTVRNEVEVFEWREVVRGLTELQVWLTAISYVGILTNLYSFAYFFPTIVVGLGYSGESAQLHTSPPYVPSAALTILLSFVADKYKMRGPVVLGCVSVTILGYIISIVATTHQVRYGAAFLIACGTFPSCPAVLAIIPNNTSGQYKRATAIALHLSIASGSGFIASFLYTSDQAPHYIRGHCMNLGFAVMAFVLMAINICYCAWENRARASGRRQGNIERYQKLWDAGKTRAPIGDRHPDFRFTL